jgi:hypothetical protein
LRIFVASVIQRGGSLSCFLADRPGEDYGTDLLVNTFDEQGYAENGDIRIQLKASDGLKYSKDKTFISLQIEGKVEHHG